MSGFKRLVVFCSVTAICCVACNGNSEIEVASETAAPQADSRPNILLIVADDLGYADLGAYGSEIPTPNLDELASSGAKMARFYVAPTCAPTRAMMLSGVDSHRAGLGNMTEVITDNQIGLPGYEGYLNRDVASVAEILRDAGYNTFMTGKWHLGLEYDQSPRARGFERSFAPLFGGGSHFDTVGPDPYRPIQPFRSDGELIDKLPEDYYSTTTFTDLMLSYMEDSVAADKPFFGFLSYTAPHWPLQAPQSEIQKFEGLYDAGYDLIREGRFERMKTLGLVAANAALPPRPAVVPAWQELSEQEQEKHARNLEIYAAMTSYMDANIGRVVEFLHANNELENTLIVFMSDNGPDSWGEEPGTGPIASYAQGFDNSLDSRGSAESFVLYGLQGAHLGASPLRGQKGTTYEGGLRVPAIMSWPLRFDGGVLVEAPASVLDLVPTFLEAAQVEHPARSDADSQFIPPSGTSLLSMLQNLGLARSEFRFGVEIWSTRAILVDQWKLVNMPAPVGSGEWELYDVVADPSETNNLMLQYPEVAERLLAAWDEYAEENGVVLPPWPIQLRAPDELPIR